MTEDRRPKYKFQPILYALSLSAGRKADPYKIFNALEHRLLPWESVFLGSYPVRLEEAQE
jgi:hypothetical protein